MKALSQITDQRITFFLMFIALSFTLKSCKKECLKNYGKEVTKEIKVSSIDKIANRVSANIIITEGNKQKIEVTGPENIIKNLTNIVVDSEYQIDVKNIFLCADYKLTFNITIPKIKKVTISGSGDFIINDFSQSDDFIGVISGAGSISFNEFKNVESMDFKISGSGKINALESSSINDLKVVLSGSGSYKGYLLESQDCTAEITGSGNCYVNAQKILNATISGAGSIYYKGEPSITTKITGAGSIKNKN